MKRKLGMIGALTWIGIFLALAVGNAHGDELAGALDHLAMALQPPPTPLPTPVVAMSMRHAASGVSGSPVLVFLVLAGLALGGGALCGWLWRRAHIHLTEP